MAESERLGHNVSPPPAPRGDSFIVSYYGLDGQREHMMPGNRKRGTPARAKRGYATEGEAREALKRSRPGSSVYQCSICGDWHIASPRRK